MKYTKVDIGIEREQVEMLTSYLMDMGIFSVEIKDAGDLKEVLSEKKKYKWDYAGEDFFDADLDKIPVVSCYPPEELGDEEISKLVEDIKNLDFPGDAKVIFAEVTTVDDEDWKNTYKEHFKTSVLTDELVIVPSWEEENFRSEDFGGRRPIFMDPGMAFGTGDHETTSMCARFMSKYGCKGKSVLDVGTGSGILAIGAYAMGATDIMGIDIDPIAVEVAVENAEKNGCADKMTLVEGDLVKGVSFKADIVVANLIAEIVVELSKHIKEHLAEDGIFISSGILTEKRPYVTEALESIGMKIVEWKDEGDWSAIVARYE